MNETKQDTNKIITRIIEEVYRGNKLIYKAESKNLTPNTGLAAFVKRMGGDGSTAAFTYIALGSGTTPAAATDTTLQTELTTDGLARAAATVSYETTTTAGDTLQLLKSFTALGSHTVSEIGIFNNASTGSMGGRVVKTSVPLEANDIYVITYQVILARV